MVFTRKWLPKPPRDSTTSPYFLLTKQPCFLPKSSPPFVQTTPTLEPTLYPIKKIWALMYFAYGILIKHISIPPQTKIWKSATSLTLKNCKFLKDSCQFSICDMRDCRRVVVPWLDGLTPKGFKKHSLPHIFTHSLALNIQKNWL